MKTMPVAQFKAQFSRVLADVQRGERVAVLYGRTRKPVAMIVPYQPERARVRELGFLDGKVSIEFRDDYEVSDEELLGLGDN